MCMDTTKIIVWGIFVCLLLIVCSMCWIGVYVPYGQATTTTNLNASIMSVLMVPAAGLLALLSVMLKELLPKSEKKDEEKKD